MCWGRGERGGVEILGFWEEMFNFIFSVGGFEIAED